MTYNPYDPTKPGEYNSWKLHADTYGNTGVGQGTTHEFGLNKPSGGGWSWGGPSSSASSSAPSYSSAAGFSSSSSRSYGGSSGGSGYGGGGSRSYSRSSGGSSAFWWVVGVIVLLGVFGGGGGKQATDSSAKASTSDAAPTSDAPTALPGAWYDGRNDREKWEQWFAGLSGDYRDGAEYWAGARKSHPSPGVCALRGRASADFRQGCLGARSFLVRVDHRRDTEADYWYGWNYLTPPQKG